MTGIDIELLQMNTTLMETNNPPPLPMEESKSREVSVERVDDLNDTIQPKTEAYYLSENLELRRLLCTMPSKKKSASTKDNFDFKFKKDEKVLILPVHTGDDIYEAKV